jgi:glycosyltransferase involved in cell wall biosynthesis
MKILQVCSGIQQLKGGAEIFALALSTKLTEAGHDITLVTSDHALPKRHDYKFSVLEIPEQNRLILRKLLFDYYSPKTVYAFSNILESLKPDIVHFHSFYGLGSFLAALSSRSCPTVVTLHDTWGTFYDGAIITPKFYITNNYWKVPLAFLHRKANERFFRNVTLVSPSIWLKSFFHAHGNFPPAIHIPNAVSGDRPVTSYKKEILWLGHLSSPKGLQTVIQTLRNVTTELDWDLTIAGDGPLRKPLQGKYSGVNFVGYVDPRMYFERASILIVSSICHENLPTVILEGMSYGLCVVGNNVGGIAELISDNDNGLLYNSSDELETLLRSIMFDPDRISRLGRAARTTVTKRYNWTKCLDHYNLLFDELLVPERLHTNI